MKPEIEKCVKYIRQFPLKEERTYYSTYWFPPESPPKEWIACLTSTKEMLSARRVEVMRAGDEVYLVTAGSEAFVNFCRFKENVDNAMKEYAVAQKERIELLRKVKEEKIKKAAFEYVD